MDPEVRASLHTKGYFGICGIRKLVVNGPWKTGMREAKSNEEKERGERVERERKEFERTDWKE